MRSSWIVVVVGAGACAQPAECEHLYDCGEAMLCAADGRCVPDDDPRVGGTIAVATPSPLPPGEAFALARPTLSGDVGPAVGLAAATSAQGTALDAVTFTVLFDVGDEGGWGFVRVDLPSREDLAARVGATTELPAPDGWSGQGCVSETGEVMNYDAPVVAGTITIGEVDEAGGAEVRIDARSDEGTFAAGAPIDVTTTFYATALPR